MQVRMLENVSPSFGSILCHILPVILGSLGFKELSYAVRNKYISEGTMLDVSE